MTGQVCTPSKAFDAFHSCCLKHTSAPLGWFVAQGQRDAILFARQPTSTDINYERAAANTSDSSINGNAWDLLAARL
jgi:hypothetical protein